MHYTFLPPLVNCVLSYKSFVLSVSSQSQPFSVCNLFRSPQAPPYGQQKQLPESVGYHYEQQILRQKVEVQYGKREARHASHKA